MDPFQEGGLTMFEVVNRTPFAVSLVPGLGKDYIANMTVATAGNVRHSHFVRTTHGRRKTDSVSCGR